MTRNKNPFNLIHPGLVSSFITFGFILLGAAGCRTPEKFGSTRMVAVLIKGSSPETINTSVNTVFEKHEFEAAPEDNNDLVFQKRASFKNSFVYADWYSGAAWVRAKLYLTELKPGEIRLDGDAYIVQEPDDPFFQKERKVKVSKSEFQKLLEEIKADAEHK